MDHVDNDRVPNAHDQLYPDIGYREKTLLSHDTKKDKVSLWCDRLH